MSSLIPGYEYDIFISYRQNDNRHDGWVTEFVDHLRAELEATFKEEISVYFDLNPHDGLLDSHDVDESLRTKLRCLIFIPVISRTYCDPKSFAWEHEFRAFVRQATAESLGLKVTLHSGNVASRILPVRIHELDPEDRELIEHETGGVLRSIDFIYREPGVNRPLSPVDDENKNQYGTRYRNQINKTANAVKEIISSLQSDQTAVRKEKHGLKEPWEETGIPERDFIPVGKKANSFRRALFSLLAVLAASALIWTLLRFNGIRPGSGNLNDKSIAVLPFENIGANEENLWLGDALTEEVISQLCKVNDLKVRPRTSVMKYRGTTRSIPDLGRELDANFIIGGSYQIFDEIVRITVKLINAPKDEQLWSNVFEGTWNEMHSMQTDIAIRTASTLQAVLTPEEKARIRKDPTGSADAYKNYLTANVLSENALYYLLSGNKFIDSISFTEAISMYDMAIKEDPGFALAYARRAIARSWGYHAMQLDPSHIEKCKADADRSLELDKDLAEAWVALGFYNYYCIGDNFEALTSFSRAAVLAPASYQPLFYMAMVYRRMGDWTRSQDLIRKVIAEEPQDALVLINIGTSYVYMHSLDTAIAFFQKASKVMPDWSGPYTSLLETFIMKDGNTVKAREVLDTIIARTGEKQLYFQVLLNIYDRNYNKAVIDVQSSTDDDFGIPGLRYLMTGLVYGLIDNESMTRSYYDSALVLYKRQVMDNPEDWYSFSCCGLAYAGLGNKTDAIIAGKTAMELASEDNLVKNDMIINLAKIYAMSGDKTEAIREVKYLLNNPSWFSVNLLKVDPAWGNLYNEPEIRSLTRK
ncbi:MAG: FlgO family outer membrane protein [Bacteroidales bacterium]|nr:FlgO family outer membrane protein [Bacteroidales bacterium]